MGEISGTVVPKLRWSMSEATKLLSVYSPILAEDRLLEEAEPLTSFKRMSVLSFRDQSRVWPLQLVLNQKRPWRQLLNLRRDIHQRSCHLDRTEITTLECMTSLTHHKLIKITSVCMLAHTLQLLYALAILLLFIVRIKHFKLIFFTQKISSTNYMNSILYHLATRTRDMRMEAHKTSRRWKGRTLASLHPSVLVTVKLAPVPVVEIERNWQPFIRSWAWSSETAQGWENSSFRANLHTNIFLLSNNKNCQYVRTVLPQPQKSTNSTELVVKENICFCHFRQNPTSSIGMPDIVEHHFH